MGIYENAQEYADLCKIPLELAKIECEKQNKIEITREKACICPTCKKKSLIIVDSDYEGSSDYIECESCGDTFLFENIEGAELLSMGADFDAVLFFSSENDETRKQLWLDACGAKTEGEWVAFATKIIKG